MKNGELNFFVHVHRKDDSIWRKTLINDARACLINYSKSN